MPIFPTAAEMRGIFAPIVEDAAVQLGSLADLYVIESVEQDDASYEPAPAFALANVPIRLTMISAETVVDTFGENPSIKFQGSLMRLYEIAEGNVFNVVSGDFSGQWLRVVQVVEQPLSDSYKLGLAEAEAIL